MEIRNRDSGELAAVGEPVKTCNAPIHLQTDPDQLTQLGLSESAKGQAVAAVSIN